VDEVNELLTRIHDLLQCSPVLRTSTINANPADFEWSATWRRLSRLPGYSRPFGEQSVSARTLPGVLRAVLDFEARYDEQERARLARREETPCPQND
jgi:hypothetical protein